MDATFTPARPDRTEANLDAALQAVGGEIGRTDAKSSLLLALNGALFAGIATAADADLPTISRITGSLAGAAFTAATVLLLLVVRPRLHGTDRASFPYWATLTTQDLQASLTDDRRLDRLQILSQIASRKFRGLARAVDLILAGIALLVVTAASLL